jgi:hypothetical protein
MTRSSPATVTPYDKLLERLDRGANHRDYPEGFGDSWTDLCVKAAWAIRHLTRASLQPATPTSCPYKGPFGCKCEPGECKYRAGGDAVAGALRKLVSQCVNPGDGGPFEQGEWPALDEARAVLSGGAATPTAPVMWVCLVGDLADRRIRAWTADHKRMESLRSEGLDMQPLYAGVAQSAPVLWCCHARGPDDVYAAPDYATALAWSDTLNALNWDTKDPRYPKPRWFKNPSLYEDCLIKAVPAPWPHSPESHAEDLPKSIEGFAMPSTEDQTP